MVLIKRIIVFLVLVITGVLLLTFFLQKHNTPSVTKGPAQITYTDEGSVIQIQHKNPITYKVTQEQIYQPDPSSTIITTDAKGNITVKVRQFGVGTSFGIGLGISTKPRLALDDRFAYYKRFGANVGLGLSLDKTDYQQGHLLDICVPYIGLSYVPWLKAANTSIVATYTIDKHIFVFIRLKF